jgi:hypothetical protein
VTSLAFLEKILAYIRIWISPDDDSFDARHEVKEPPVPGMQSEAKSKMALERRERKKLREKRKQERLGRRPVQPE